MSHIFSLIADHTSNCFLFLTIPLLVTIPPSVHPNYPPLTPASVEAGGLAFGCLENFYWQYKDSCYTVTSRQRHFLDTSRHSEKLDAKLVEIESEGESKFLKGKVNNFFANYTSLGRWVFFLRRDLFI